MIDDTRTLQNAFAYCPSYVTRIDNRKTVKELLMIGEFWSSGELYEFKAKHVGLGVYELSAKRKPLPPRHTIPKL